MKFLSVISLLTLLAVAGHCEQIYAKGKSSKETISSDNKQRTYYLFVPESGDTQRKQPLLLLLHGSNRNGQSLIDKWKDLADKEKIIIAAPDSTNPTNWSVGKDGPDFLRDLVEALKAKYPIDERRVYLFGHSAGAGFAIYMSLFESEYFAAMAIHAGALPPEDYWVVARATRKIPMAIWVGDRDPFFPLKLVRGTRDVLVSKGFSVELTEMPNHNHWYYDLAPKINRNAWDFLSKHQLAGNPQYKQYQFQN
jgi:poly(3-hydroxybutyrate) depolymerase